MTVWIYQPLLNTIFLAPSQEAANAIMYREGGSFHTFDHLPTLEEKFEAWVEYKKTSTQG